MTDLPDAAPNGTASASTPDGETPAGDPELTALVRHDPPPDDAEPSLTGAPAVDETAQASETGPAAGDATPETGADAAEPVLDASSASADSTSADPDEPAPVAADAAAAGSPTAEATSDDAITADAPAQGEPIDTAAADTSPASEPGVDAVPDVPVAAAVTEDEPAAAPRRRRSLAFRFGASFVLGFLLAAGIGVGVLYAYGQQYDGRILPGVRVGSTELGGLTREQAEAKIANAYGSLATGQIRLTGPDGQMTTISFADVGRGPDTSALLDAAFAAGRQGGPLASLIGETRAAIHGVTLDSAVAYDRDKLAAAVATLATTIDQTPVDASVSSGQGGTFSATLAKDGRAVDKAALQTALDRQLATLGTPASITMAVPVVPLAPAVATASAEAAKAAANRMAADVVVTRAEDSWTIAGTSLAPLISFSTAADGSITPVFDESGLDPILTALAKKVNQTVQDAGLEMVAGHIVATGSSREGRTLNAAGMKAAIIGEIGAREAGAAASLVPAVVKTVDPKLTTTAAQAFAPNMRQISSFSVYYFVIVNNHWGGNIEAPATKINGTVVPAGTVFDFWKVVGDLRKLPGEGPGNAIEGGKITVTGAFGGGICTTSTTLFNAAFRAGMIPLARQNHNEFINRYPPGLDATVWIVGSATQTMSFKNDTEYPIMITRTITNAGSRRWITFKIWSVPNGRTYKISNLIIQPGPRAIDTVVRDRTKPVGYAFRNNSPVDGAKVWVTVTIYDHGKLHWTKRYFSNYPAVNGVLVLGART
ncbi:MAG TPA: VanW family protein [Candidatus Bathyarchaeia archaeon]|nr:VanW family protein [Candidatus Bathyarchaeia archaeon]